MTNPLIGSQMRKRVKQNISVRGTGNGVDRISSLPEPIISNILSSLPTKNAVATSALSKRWKLRWTKVTSFDVDDERWPDKRGRSRSVPQMGFAEFVKMVLNNQTADSRSVNRFRLRCNSLRSQYSFLRNWTNHVKLPGELYTCRYLKVLKLAGPVLVQLLNKVCLPKLVVLELYSVIYESNESLHKLISCCPVLKSLTVKRTSRSDNLVVCTISSPTLKRLQICFNFDNDDQLRSYVAYHVYEQEARVEMSLEIDAPALEYLVLNDTVSEKISFHGLTSVREVDLETKRFAGYKDSMVVGLVQTFNRVKVMKLGRNVMTTLAMAANKLSGNYESVTKLAVTCDLSWRPWICFIDLINCFVKLEVIEIVIHKSEYPNCESEDESEDRPEYEDESEDRPEYEDGPEYEDEAENGPDSRVKYSKDSVHAPTCLSSSLRQVTIREFDVEKGLMAMLKFILDHGLVMERVNLCFAECIDDESIDCEGISYDDEPTNYREIADDVPIDYEERYRVHEKLLMLSRASPACRIQVVSGSFRSF